jgi:hypothetical protein
LKREIYVTPNASLGSLFISENGGKNYGPKEATQKILSGPEKKSVYEKLNDIPSRALESSEFNMRFVLIHKK